MSVLVLAQILLAIGLATAAANGFRRARAVAARRERAFEDFAAGRGLSVFRTDSGWQLADAEGMIARVEPATDTADATTIAVSLPEPRLATGVAVFALSKETLTAVPAGIAVHPASGPLRGHALPFGLGALASANAVRLIDTKAIALALTDPALRPARAGGARIVLNHEGLHLQLTRRLDDPGDLAPVLDTMRDLRDALAIPAMRQAA